MHKPENSHSLPKVPSVALSSVLVVRDDGEEGDFCPPITSLDWALFCVKNVCPRVGVSCDDQTMALLTAIDEDSPWEIKGVCSISRGRRELLNLACSINYENTGVSSRRGKGGSCFLALSASCGLLVFGGFGFEDFF